MKEESLTTDIYKLIRERIFEKKFLLSKKINQSKLADEFGVSRTPIVTALHKLETEGLVDNIPQKGFYVHRLNIKELANLYAVLEGLNSILFLDTFEGLTPKQLKKIEDIFAPFKDNWSPKTREKYRKAVRIFHNFFWDLCQNDMAKHIYSTFEILERAGIAGLMREPAETLPEHLAIIASLKTKDYAGASKQMVEHFAKTRRKLQKIIHELSELRIDASNISVEELPNEFIIDKKS
jgi:DNA-binding GntR family transcriptional regulator